MILISCADNALGLRFNHRRQSRDRVVCGRMLEKSGGRLWLAEETKGLFAGFPEAELTIVSDPAAVPVGGFCFWEGPTDAPAERIILYRWNRDYPGDERFCFPGGEETWQLDRWEDFPGFSHEKITEEIYIHKE